MAIRQLNYRCAAAVTSALATLCLSSPCMAQELANADNDVKKEVPAPALKNTDQIQTVIITANKRKEDASKVPLSISVVGGDELEAQHINDFASATRAIPNISFSGGGGGGNAGNGPGLSNVEMRGVSSTAGSATVGIYLDDVSMTVGNAYSMGSAEPKFFDLDHIEVLRGPQGTLYGASSMGGTVKFISNQPNLQERSTSIAADVSSTSGGGINHTETAIFNEALIANELALRIGLQSAHKGGYINQVDPVSGATIAKGINSEDDEVARLAMKWAPTKNLAITPSLFYQKVKSGDIDVSYTKLADGTTLPNNETPKKIREPGIDTLIIPSLTINYASTIGDITSVTSYFKRTFSRTQDGTTVNVPFIASQVQNDPALTATVAGLTSAVYLDNAISQFSQEVRLASKSYDPSVSPFTWVIGAYAINTNTRIVDNEPVFGINAAFTQAGKDITSVTDLGPYAVTAGFPGDSSYHAYRTYHDAQQAIFGEGNYYFSPTVHFTTGLRFLQAKEVAFTDRSLFFTSDGTNNGIAKITQEITESKATPKFALTWEVNPSNTLYASAAEGFRVGGTNIAVPLGYCQMTTANPLSYQSDSLWSYEIGSKSRFLNNTLSMNAALFHIDWKNLQQQIYESACGYEFNVNVGNATSNGGEFEIKYKPTAQLVIDLAGGLTHATLSDSAGANSGITGAVKGASIYGVPKFNAALTGQYNFNFSEDKSGFLRAGAHWTGTSHGSLDPSSLDYQRPAYANVDASAGLKFESWDVSLYVNNIANSQKVIQRPMVQSQPSEVYRLTPRTIGFTVNGNL
ncbi:TonB-dependent receptor [Sapientia aquatica]|uniref:TonB-dependent receptor n=1 Tax=Sapientia aquatica TaxID=1549640 RepID=A0A4R5VN10_9BURK|nr:TonB-dependent receptor [Sapientia aquatica]TDK59651.1 TonB-dependent receptor [Sapientia aquatica]